MTGIGEQLFRPVGVVYRGVRGRLPEGFVTVRHDRVAGDLGIAERQRVIGAFAVDRPARSAPHPFVMPRRFRVPLVREIETEDALHDRRL